MSFRDEARVAAANRRFKDGMNRATDLLPPEERDELYRDLAQIARRHRQQSAVDRPEET